MLLGAANLDPRKWPEPERYDIDRSTAGHVGFGSGVHMCVGQLLARLEGEALIGAVARAFSSLEPDGEPEPLTNNTCAAGRECRSARRRRDRFGGRPAAGDACSPAVGVAVPQVLGEGGKAPGRMASAGSQPTSR
jgi:hypothetical protein